MGLELRQVSVDRLTDCISKPSEIVGIVFHKRGQPFEELKAAIGRRTPAARD